MRTGKEEQGVDLQVIHLKSVNHSIMVNRLKEGVLCL